jgi:DNA replication initiation complex subunit (GINS family)
LMSGEELGFSEISEAYRNERKSKLLTKLPPRFYERADGYLEALKGDYEAQAKGRSGPKTMMLLDEIGKIEKSLKMIMEIRERKVVLAALAKMGGSPIPENMTNRDHSLFDAMISVLERHRGPEEPVKGKEEVLETPEPEAVEAVECQSTFVEPEKAGEKEESMVVHVLEDLQPFVSLDHTYELSKDDVATLPAEYAALLSEKGKVRIIEE